MVTYVFDNRKNIELDVSTSGNRVEVFLSLTPNQLGHIVTWAEPSSQKFFSMKITGSPEYKIRAVLMDDNFQDEVAINHNRHKDGNTIVQIIIEPEKTARSGSLSRTLN